MAYTDFTPETIRSKLGITIQPGLLFPDLQPVDVPSWLTESLERGMQLGLVTEKARSEFIVAPVLLALRECSGFQIAILSGQRLDVDASLSLMGECDFILARSPPLPFLQSPLLTLVEAKKNDIESGLAQCIAQMVAARTYNEQSGVKRTTIHGCVTTGRDWQFLRLTGTTVELDTRMFYINQLGEILAALLETVRE